MAYIVFHDDRRAAVSAEKGRALWDVLTGKKEGDPAQQKFAMTVKKLYLNWRNAPDDYLLQNKDLIAPMVQRYWMVEGTPTSKKGEHTSTGKLTRPDPTDLDAIRVSRLLGLI